VTALVPLESGDKIRIRAAAFRATQLYPGPVGELIARELGVWEQFGYRLDQSGLIARLIDHITHEETS
jgi:hypothetical protein